MKKSSSRLLIMLSILMAVLVLIQVGCGTPSSPIPTTTTKPTPTVAPTVTAKPTPTVTQTTAPTPTPTQTTAVKTLTLEVSDIAVLGPAGLPTSINKYMEEVTKRTNGRVKFNMHWAQSLVKASDMPEAMSKGIVDGGSFVPAYFASKAPLSNVGELPGASANSLTVTLAFYELYNTTPVIQKEWEQYNAKLMWPYVSTNFNLLLKKPAATLADIKGLKVRAHSVMLSNLVASLGVTPVSVNVIEVYEALARGVVEGVITYPEVIGTYRWYEAATNYLIANIGAACQAGFVLSLDAWKKISPEDQKIIEGVNKEWLTYHPAYIDKVNDDVVKQIAGFKTTTLPAADLEKVRTAGLALWDTWINNLESKGLPGKELAAKWKSLTEKYDKQSSK